MGCCKPRTNSPPPRPRVLEANHREEAILQVPGASVHLMDGEEAVELAVGDLFVLGIFEEGVPLATIVRVGPELQWPLAKDEPVVRLDELHYLFSLPEKGGSFLNYGVSFAGPDGRLASLDSFLKDNACFTASSSSSPSSSSGASSLGKQASSGGAYWGSLAPKVEGYNGMLAKAIAGGTGEIVKGIFKCSDVYASRVRKGADMFQLGASGVGKPRLPRSSSGSTSMGKSRGGTITADAKRGGINTTLRRVRQLSELTEKMSRSLLNGAIVVSGSVTTPMLTSKAGKALLGSVPGVVLLASLDAVNKVLDAVEAAERKTLAATGHAVAGVVSQRFGEGAGEATEDVFATAGHAVGTAWNLFKIRKAINPSSSVSSSHGTSSRSVKPSTPPHPSPRL